MSDQNSWMADDRLVDQIASKNLDARKELYRQLVPWMIAAVKKMALKFGLRPEADEAAQDVVGDMWERWNSVMDQYDPTRRTEYLFISGDP